MVRRISFLSVFLFLVVLFPPAFSSAFAADSYLVTNGATETIDEHGVCKDVTNNAGGTIMVPCKTANEWHTGGQSFLENLPPNVTVADCAIGGNCTPAQENTFTQVADLPETKSYAASAPLSDGRVLICGGWMGGGFGNPTNRCDIYDPVADSFTQITNLPQSKGYLPAATLSDGRVLICGGSTGVFAWTNRCDIYDPFADSFTQVANLPQNKGDHSSVTLSDGRVLICGGNIGASSYTNRCDIYDPVADSFTQVTNLPQSKSAATADTLSDGHVLICGGSTGSITNRCDIYDPVADSFTQMSDLPETKSAIATATLSDGRPLFCGGYNSPNHLNRCDVYVADCPVGCSNRTINWSNCSAASGSMTHGQNKSVTNTASGYTGTRDLTCNNGTISQSGGSCVVSGPTGCPNIGDVCSDGSIYAGLSNMYSTNTNQSNSINLNNARNICNDLNRHGRTDWSLPSRTELTQLYTYRIAIGGFAGGYHWSSWYNSPFGIARFFSHGGENAIYETNLVSARCIRRHP